MGDVSLGMVAQTSVMRAIDFGSSRRRASPYDLKPRSSRCGCWRSAVSERYRSPKRTDRLQVHVTSVTTRSAWAGMMAGAAGSGTPPIWRTTVQTSMSYPRSRTPPSLNEQVFANVGMGADRRRWCRSRQFQGGGVSVVPKWALINVSRPAWRAAGDIPRPACNDAGKNRRGHVGQMRLGGGPAAGEWTAPDPLRGSNDFRTRLAGCPRCAIQNVSGHMKDGEMRRTPPAKKAGQWDPLMASPARSDAPCRAPANARAPARRPHALLGGTINDLIG